MTADKLHSAFGIAKPSEIIVGRPMTIAQVVELAERTAVVSVRYPEPPAWWVETHGFTIEQYREAKGDQ